MMYSHFSMSSLCCKTYSSITTWLVISPKNFATFLTSTANRFQQLRPPTTQVYLPNLRSFTIRHKKITDRTGTPYLSRWIRQVASQSPIEELVLLTERGYPSGATVNLDGVVQHLRSRHHTTLRVLNMNPSYVRKKTLRKLFSDCPHLEEVGVGIHASLLVRSLNIFGKWITENAENRKNFPNYLILEVNYAL